VHAIYGCSAGKIVFFRKDRTRAFARSANGCRYAGDTPSGDKNIT
jgi:hypothetical protein